MSDSQKAGSEGSAACVPGFTVGHAEHPEHPTGVSVVLCPPGTVAGIDVRGSAPATRQIDGLTPGFWDGEVHGVCLTGGSSFGLDAAGGVVRFLEERGRGLSLGPFILPKVPCAVIFDLPITGGRGRPGPELAYAACQNAREGATGRGNLGAGAGATVGKLFGLERAMKGGVGGALHHGGGVMVGSLCVVNAFGDVLDEAGEIMAGARGEDGRGFAGTASWFMAGGRRRAFHVADNTTLAVVTTNAILDKGGACKVAAMAHHGLVRAINPVHTAFDGDLVLVLASGQVEADLNGLGIMAASVVAAGIRDAIRGARGLPGLPAACDIAL